MKLLYIVIGTIFLLFGINTFGQIVENKWITPCFHCTRVQENDWGAIFQTTVSKRVNKSLKGEFNVQSRIMEQFQSFKSIMFEPGVKYKPRNHFAIKTAFRFTVQPKTKGLRLYNNSNYYRIHIAGYYVWHKESVPIRIQYRTRLEKEGNIYWRNRVKVAFNIKNVIKPYSSFEFFNNCRRGVSNVLYRYEGGAKIEIHKRCNATLMYRLECYNVRSRNYSRYKTQVFGMMINYSLGDCSTTE